MRARVSASQAWGSTVLILAVSISVYAMAAASPWPGEIAVFRSASTDGFNLVTTFGSRARIGTLAFDFFPGPTSRFDLGNALVVDLLSGTLESVTDVALFGGANALAVESAAGQWEIVQAGQAELIGPGRYSLTRECGIVSTIHSGHYVALEAA